MNDKKLYEELGIAAEDLAINMDPKDCTYCRGSKTYNGYECYYCHPDVEGDLKTRQRRVMRLTREMETYVSPVEAAAILLNGTVIRLARNPDPKTALTRFQVQCLMSFRELEGWVGATEHLTHKIEKKPSRAKIPSHGGQLANLYSQRGLVDVLLSESISFKRYRISEHGNKCLDLYLNGKHGDTYRCNLVPDDEDFKLGDLVYLCECPTENGFCLAGREPCPENKPTELYKVVEIESEDGIQFVIVDPWTYRDGPLTLSSP